MVHSPKKSPVKMSSELVKCARQINSMGFSLFLFVIAMILAITIPVSEYTKLVNYTNGTSMDKPSDDVMNKIMAGSFFIVFGAFVLIASILMATYKGCYKTSLFGIMFGLATGVL
jgi:hypothetical protein